MAFDLSTLLTPETIVGAGGGMAIGGPIGSLIGAAGGYALSALRAASGKPAVAPPPVTGTTPGSTGVNVPGLVGTGLGVAGGVLTKIASSTGSSAAGDAASKVGQAAAGKAANSIITGGPQGPEAATGYADANADSAALDQELAGYNTETGAYAGEGTEEAASEAASSAGEEAASNVVVAGGTEAGADVGGMAATAGEAAFAEEGLGAGIVTVGGAVTIAASVAILGKVTLDYMGVTGKSQAAQLWTAQQEAEYAFHYPQIALYNPYDGGAVEVFGLKTPLSSWIIVNDDGSRDEITLRVDPATGRAMTQPVGGQPYYDARGAVIGWDKYLPPVIVKPTSSATATSGPAHGGSGRIIVGGGGKE